LQICLRVADQSSAAATPWHHRPLKLRLPARNCPGLRRAHVHKNRSCCRLGMGLCTAESWGVRSNRHRANDLAPLSGCVQLNRLFHFRPIPLGTDDLDSCVSDIPLWVPAHTEPLHGTRSSLFPPPCWLPNACVWHDLNARQFPEHSAFLSPPWLQPGQSGVLMGPRRFACVGKARPTLPPGVCSPSSGNRPAQADAASLD